jgi:hypothetical protein
VRGAAPGALLAYERARAGRRILVVLNIRPRPARVPLPDDLCGRVSLSTGLDRGDEVVRGPRELGGHDGLAIALA